MTPDPTTAASGGLSPTQEAALIAQRFHEAYERLAPSFSYETRKESAKPWADVPANNRALMTAVAAELMSAGLRLGTHPSPPSPARGEELEAGAFRAALDAFHDSYPQFTEAGRIEIAIRAYLAARPPVTMDAGAVTLRPISEAGGEPSWDSPWLVGSEQGWSVAVTRFGSYGIGSATHFAYLPKDATCIARLARAPAEGGEKAA